MKKKMSVVLVFAMLLSMLSLGVAADDHLTCDDVVHLHDETAAVNVVYPSCPVDSSHVGRTFATLGEQGHAAYCRECGARLEILVFDHVWYTGTPNCTTAKYCVLCNHHAIGGEALGHIVYPAASDEYVKISSMLHGHICQRSGCIYNPSSFDYTLENGYLPNYPYGAHDYNVLPRYTTYQDSTNNRWYHRKYWDCAKCEHTDVSSAYLCLKNDPDCVGTCTERP